MRRKGCLRCGCLGCLGLAALLAVIGGVVLVIGVAIAPGDPLFEDLELESTPPDLSGVREDRDGTGHVELGPDAPAAARGVGRIVLDVSRIVLEIQPGPPGSAMRLEGRYDTAAFELDWGFEEGDGEAAWTYRLEVDPRGLPVQFDSDTGNELRLVVPRDLPFRLEGAVGMGVSSLELGGLDVRAVELDLGVGEHTLSFAEPTPSPLETFEVNGSVGELVVDGLGWASPRRVELALSMGDLSGDLRGPWRTDTTIVVRTGIGATRLEVPDDVRLVTRSTNLAFGELSVPAERDESGATEMVLDVSHTLGELHVGR